MQNRKIIAYKVAKWYTLNELEACVMRNIQSGWQPLGGVTFSSGIKNGETVVSQPGYCQTLVRYAKEEKEV